MKVAILSLDPRNGGGILHSLLAAYKFFLPQTKPTVFFLDFSPEISTSLRNFATKNQTKQLNLFGMDCVAIGSRWAFWEPGHYYYTLPQWREALADQDCFFVSSGTPIAAHPLMLLQKPFVAWLATSLEGDRIGKQNSWNPFRNLLASSGKSRLLKIERQVLESCNYLLPMSSYAQQSFGKIANICAPQAVCGYPIDEQSLVEESAKNIVPTAISIGRFDDPRKDIGSLLEAWQIVLKTIKLAQLWLIGSPPAASIFKKYRSMFDQGQVVMHSMVSAKEKQALLGRAHVAVISSLQEGLCIAGLEAAAAGLPIVSTQCGGPKDYVLEGLSGFLVPPAKPEALAQKLVKLLNNPALATKLGFQGRSLVKHFYQEARIFETFSTAMKTVWPKFKPNLMPEASLTM